MKKYLAFMLAVAMAFYTFGITLFADNGNKTEAEYEIVPAEIDVSANSALLMEASTGKILFEKNADSAASPASVTKIMTLLLVMEAIDSGALTADDKIFISSYAAGMGGSQVFLKEGESMTVEELIKCAVIASANDAAVALAETVAGSEDAFVRRMNEKAKALGMNNTNFENVTGLDDTTVNHVTSARDIAIMSRELIKYDLITKYSSLWQDTIRNGEFTLTNTNRLVRFYDGCNGLKTGSTDKAGFCISATAKRGEMQLIAVIMGADTRDDRNQAARALLDCGFANYAVYSEGEAEVERVPVYSGEVDELSVYSAPFSAIVNKSDVSRVSKSFDIPNNINAPCKCGDVVGSIVYSVGGVRLGESKIFIKEDVEKISLFDIFGRILHAVVCGSAKKEE